MVHRCLYTLELTNCAVQAFECWLCLLTKAENGPVSFKNCPGIIRNSPHAGRRKLEFMCLKEYIFTSILSPKMTPKMPRLSWKHYQFIHFKVSQLWHLVNAPVLRPRRNHSTSRMLLRKGSHAKSAPHSACLDPREEPAWTNRHSSVTREKLPH